MKSSLQFAGAARRVTSIWRPCCITAAAVISCQKCPQNKTHRKSSILMTAVQLVNNVWVHLANNTWTNFNATLRFRERNKSQVVTIWLVTTLLLWAWINYQGGRTAKVCEHSCQLDKQNTANNAVGTMPNFVMNFNFWNFSGASSREGISAGSSFCSLFLSWVSPSPSKIAVSLIFIRLALFHRLIAVKRSLLCYFDKKLETIWANKIFSAPMTVKIFDHFSTVNSACLWANSSQVPSFSTQTINLELFLKFSA